VPNVDEKSPDGDVDANAPVVGNATAASTNSTAPSNSASIADDAVRFLAL
jgi:hypothetical protein